MQLSQKQIIIAGIVGIVIILFALMIFGIIPGLQSPDKGPTTRGDLSVWLFNETESTFYAISENFASQYPGITVKYRVFSNEAVYENSIIDALAAGYGPDIFMVRNNNLPKYVNKIIPAPPTIITPQNMRALFPQVVSNDFVWGDAVFGVPFFVDTLSLIYNKDHFNENSVVFPPKTWDEFTGVVTKLKREGSGGNITRAGAAIGGANNITHAADILSLLMLQMGTEMVNNNYTYASFDSESGDKALSFYTQFSNARNEFYTWNETLPNDLQAFSEERTSIVFGYYDTIEKIRAFSPFINVGIAKMPQIQNSERDLGYASYWGFVVSRQSKNADHAWKFINLTAADENMARTYSEKTYRPPALLNLINVLINDEVYGPFAAQSLIARSWLTPDAIKTDSAFRDAIGSVVSGALATQNALSNASEFITSLMPQLDNQ